MSNNVMYRCFMVNMDEVFTPVIKFQELPIVKETEKCFWVINKKHERVLVLKDGNGKRFAYMTKELALNGFLHKRLRYQKLLQMFSEGNATVIEVIKRMQKDINYKYSPHTESF